MAEQNDALKELGRLITERREEKGMTLETVFDRTKIRQEYLKGIEEGNYKDFPELVYIKGFIRTYLKLINAEDLLDDFNTQLEYAFGQKKNDSRYDRAAKSERSHKTENIAKKDTKPKNENKNILGNGSPAPKGFKHASHFWLFLVLVAALIGTGSYVWYAMNYGGLDLKNLKLFNFSGAGGPLITSDDTSGEIVSVEIDDDISGDVDSEDELEAEQPNEPEAKPYLEIHAANDVWLSVSMGNSQPVFRRTLKRGSSMRWDLDSPARVVIGRPTAAQVILNGKDLGIVNPTAKRAETYIYNPDGTYQRVNPR